MNYRIVTHIKKHPVQGPGQALEFYTKFENEYFFKTETMALQLNLIENDQRIYKLPFPIIYVDGPKTLFRTFDGKLVWARNEAFAPEKEDVVYLITVSNLAEILINTNIESKDDYKKIFDPLLLSEIPTV